MFVMSTRLHLSRHTQFDINTLINPSHSDTIKICCTQEYVFVSRNNACLGLCVVNVLNKLQVIVGFFARCFVLAPTLSAPGKTVEQLFLGE